MAVTGAEATVVARALQASADELAASAARHKALAARHRRAARADMEAIARLRAVAAGLGIEVRIVRAQEA